jgi:hypothetical protein
MNQIITTSENLSLTRQIFHENSREISATTGVTLKSTAFLNHAGKPTVATPNTLTKLSSSTITENLDSIHKQFLILGRERHKITYKLLALLPQIYKEKVYEKHGFATIYEYAGKLAGLSHSTVEKALKLEEKLKDKPLLQKAIETQGVHKVAIIANLATSENEKMFVDKVENIV